MAKRKSAVLHRPVRGSQAAVPAWKKLQDEVADYFIARVSNEPMVYHRFYDTNAANVFLPAQPGDHLVVMDGHSTVIETKYSSKHVSLVACFSSAFTPTQLPFARLWTRAGADFWVIFKGLGEYELWDGALLYEKMMDNERLSRLEVINLAPTLDDLLAGQLRAEQWACSSGNGRIKR